MHKAITSTPRVSAVSAWSVDSWKTRPAVHQPEYPDPAAVGRAIAKLRTLPPLVTSWEIERLKSEIADAQQGKRFLLQGGDCAESLADCTPDIITNKLKILLQMSLVLVHGGKKPVIRVGRFAGQFAKPRSSPTETIDGTTLPSYFGDLINGLPFTAESRTPDPHLMVRGYQHGAMTLNFIRSLIDAGFADLHHPEYWDVGFCENTEVHEEYQGMVRSLLESIGFMESIGGGQIGELTRVEFFTSHEGLLLEYEAAGTRTVPRRQGFYNLTTHFPWIGDRSRDPEGSHVEYFRGIRNPIGVKISPRITADELLRLIDVLNPDNEPGRLTFIHRMGAGRIAENLPDLVKAVGSAGRTVLWVCDPMHGNTRSTTNGTKTRDFADIVSELTQAFDIHEANNSHLGGVHFELTGDHVTECTGGARNLSEDGLSENYRTPCDPRLNYEQSLEMALLIAKRLARS